jgi:hypothetical protein
MKGDYAHLREEAAQPSYPPFRTCLQSWTWPYLPGVAPAAFSIDKKGGWSRHSGTTLATTDNAEQTWPSIMKDKGKAAGLQVRR